MSKAMRLMDDPDQLVEALSPIRRRLLEALTEPASATELAPVLGLSRQKLNYHLHVLERLGLVELVELRQRRGCTERMLRRTADVVIDPAMMAPPVDLPVEPTAGPGRAVAARDRHAAEHLIQVAGATVRDVARMQQAATERGQRLLTFTIEAEVGFAEPADVHRYTDELAAAVAAVSEKFNHPGGRRYAVTIAGHPAPSREVDPDDSPD